MNDDFLNQINTIDFHDQTVTGISLDLANKNMNLEFEIFDDISGAYNRLTIFCTEIRELKCTNLTFDVLSELDIISFEVLSGSKEYFLKIACSLGFGLSIFQMEFRFLNGVVSRGSK